MTIQPRNTPATLDILGAGAGGPLPAPSPWTQGSGFLSYGGAIVIGNPSGGPSGGGGSLNLQTIFINGVQFLPANYLPIVGGTLTGPLFLSADPTAAFGAATKGYVDARAWLEAPNDGSAYERKSNGWVRDPIQADAPNDGARYIRQSLGWAADPVQTDAPNDASTYGRHANAWTAVLTPGSAASTYLPLAGGTLTGDLVLYGSAPAASTSAVPRSYVDARAWQEAPNDTFRYVRVGNSWARDPLQSDAPNDGKIYIRQSLGWAADPVQTDAPNDGTRYERRNQAWSADPIQIDAPADSSFYARQNNVWAAIPAGPGGPSRSTVGNVNYTVLATDKYVATSVALTAPRVWTLPAASAVAAGTPIVFSDDFNATTTANTVSVTPAGTDTINGSTAPVVLGTGPRQGAVLYSDGASNWSYANRAPGRLDGTTIGATTQAPAAVSSLSVTGNVAVIGNTTLGADPTLPLQAATKQYVDAHSGSAYISDNPPSSPAPNQLWWNSNDGLLYIYYNDGNSTQWVIATPQPNWQGYIDASDSPNAIQNGSFYVWQRGPTITIPGLGTYYHTCDGWFIAQAGGANTVAQANSPRLSSGQAKSRWAMQIQGNTGNTSNICLTRIESDIASVLAGKTCTFQMWVYNGTGASITPQLLTQYPGAVDNYATTTTDLALVNLQPCPNGVSTLVSYTFVPSLNCQNGMNVQISLPAANTAAKYIYLMEVALQVTPGLPTGLNANPPPAYFRNYADELFFAQRYFYVMPICYGQYPCPSTGGFAMQVLYYFARPMRVPPSNLLGGFNSGYTNIAAFNHTATDLSKDSWQVVGSAATNCTWSFGPVWFSAEI